MIGSVIDIIGHMGIWITIYKCFKQQAAKYEAFNEHATENKKMYVLGFSEANEEVNSLEIEPKN